jgi:hypothetical protein
VRVGRRLEYRDDSAGPATLELSWPARASCVWIHRPSHPARRRRRRRAHYIITWRMPRTTTLSRPATVAYAPLAVASRPAAMVLRRCVARSSAPTSIQAGRVVHNASGGVSLTMRIITQARRRRVEFLARDYCSRAESNLASWPPGAAAAAHTADGRGGRRRRRESCQPGDLRAPTASALPQAQVARRVRHGQLGLAGGRRPRTPF